MQKNTDLTTKIKRTSPKSPKQDAMYKILSIAALINLLFCSCTSNNSGNNSNVMNAQTDTKVNGDFYKRLEGTIAHQPIIMHLQKTGNRYEGIYYYTNKGRWLELFVDSTSADTLYLEEWANGDNWAEGDTKNAQLHLHVKNHGAEGTWKSGDGKKSYAFSLRENYPEGAYPFYVERFSDSLLAFDNRKASPQATIEYAFVASKENEWLNTQIKKSMGLDTALDYKKGFAKEAREYLQGYKNELSDYNDTSGLPLATLNYTQMQQVFVCCNAADFVVLEHSFYEFSGGAHGNHGSTFYCLDVQQKKQLRLSDVVTADSATLQPFVEKYFREQYHLGKAALNTILFDNYLGPNQNFYFNEKGIGFVYNPYEVAAYAMGQVNVFIPFTAIKQYLTPFVKQRLKL